ncbi:MAG: fibronectin type III domain-containing protein, partial [Elusimicrobia bacterium]|nr:fibronectin type III domain-containing protein [Elusimicrobiota bacterium]
MTVTVSGGTKHGFGFTSEKAGGTKVGSFTAGAGSQVSGINLTHNSGQVSNPATWTFTWTAPSAGQGTVTLYAAGNATNNNGATSGDNVTTGNWSVLEDNVPPGGISSLTALSGSNPGEIQLNWTAPGNDGTSYNFTGAYVIKYSSVGIIRSADFDSPPAALAAGSVALATSSVLPGTGVGRLFTGLNEGARYWFAIKSTDSSRNVSVWNSSADVATVNLLLSTSATLSSPSPRNVSFFAVAVDSVSLRWDLISGNSYVAVFSTSSDFVGANTSSGTASLNQNTTSYSGLDPNNLYYFKVKLSSQSDSFYSTSISSYTLPRSPAISSFRVFTTSITVVSLSNGNPVGTVWAISTGSFDSSNSSQTSRLAGDPQTPLTLTNLISNSSYTLNLRAVNFGNVPSSTTVITSTFTLPAAPGTITFDSISKDAITLSWGANGNSLTPPTSYQVQVSSNDSAFATRTTSDTFRLNLTTSSLSPLTTYYFRIFAYGSGGTNSAFGDTVSTRTRFTQVILSTGGTLVTGGVSLTAEAGVQVTLEELSDGQIQHTILSTQTAHLAYGNGFSLDLPRSVEARILPTTSGLTFTSTRSVPISEGTFTVEPSSGTATLVNSASSLSVSLATGAIQNILASVPASSAKSLSISLNPASGEIKMDLPKAALSDAVQLRMKI